MIQVYADDELVYDSRLASLELVDLVSETGLNVGGTAEIVMPRAHPAYNAFTSSRTVVTIFRDGLLRFRGRVLYHEDEFYGQRTVICEGELCFLRDGIIRPCSFNDEPKNIFTSVLEDYNSQVEPFKQFVVGEITVTDEAGTVELEILAAETAQDTINRLLDRCGGYIRFSSNDDGQRVINWYASLEKQSNQTIEFGENLLDFASTGSDTTDLATGLIPYGAKNSKTGKLVTIESVNDGKDYILADDAIAVFGTIMTTKTWNDVTDPAALLEKAKAYLEEAKMYITSLELTALDLSYLDKSLDSFADGDQIRVISIPHGVDEYFQLTKLKERYLYPAQSTISLGKEKPSLTAGDVAGDVGSHSALENTQAQIVQNSTNMEQRMDAFETRLKALEGA